MIRAKRRGDRWRSVAIGGDRSPWIATDRHESLRIATDRHGSPRIATDRHRSPRIAMGRHESPRIATNRHVSPPIATDRYRSTLEIAVACHEMLWQCRGSVVDCRRKSGLLPRRSTKKSNNEHPSRAGSGPMSRVYIYYIYIYCSRSSDAPRAPSWARHPLCAGHREGLLCGWDVAAQ